MTERNLYLCNKSHLALLERLRTRIESGVPLTSVDSITPGDKYSHVSWGACTEDLEMWPDAADMLWPEQWPGRIAPKYRNDSQYCPMDRDPDGGSFGCFYRCRVFSPNKGDGKMTKGKALGLYQITIDKMKAKS